MRIGRDIYRTTIKIAWPAILEALLVTSISIVDTYMVSELGDTAISAVGLTGQPYLLAICVFLSLNVGITATVARRRGEGNAGEANTILRQCLVLALLLSALIMLPMVLFTGPIMSVAGATAETVAPSAMYLRILCMGLPLQAVTMTINAAQRGCGNTRT
ncbi:MAG: MATE family efflux transporter, partial [Clostridia bacterium]|nr:MATE family efflux transporter [Clostridia bacterium]